MSSENFLIEKFKAKDRDISTLEMKLDYAIKAIKRAYYYLEDGDDLEAKQDMSLTYQFLIRE